MILDLHVTPKMFFTASTDLTVRAWVYEFEENVRIFKGHQHSVGQITFAGGHRKLGLSTLLFSIPFSVMFLDKQPQILS